MPKYQIRKEIAELIDSIKEHSDNIGDIRYIPQLELESILHKIEKLYEKSIVFNYLNSLPETRIETMVKLEEKITLTLEPIIEEIQPKQEIVQPEEPAKAVAPLESKPVQPEVEKAPPIAEPVAEKKKEESTPIKPTTNKIIKPAITDIKSVIGINDKFQFISELFGGNAQEYAAAIQQLNSSGTLDSAMEYINNLQNVYNWDLENETVKRLVDFVIRRYS